MDSDNKIDLKNGICFFLFFKHMAAIRAIFGGFKFTFVIFSERDVVEAPFLRCFGKSDILINLWNLVYFCYLLNGLPILINVRSSCYTHYYIILTYTSNIFCLVSNDPC